MSTDSARKRAKSTSNSTKVLKGSGFGDSESQTSVKLEDDYVEDSGELEVNTKRAKSVKYVGTRPKLCNSTQQKMGDIIGKGAAAVVHKAKNEETGEPVAVKKIRKQPGKSDQSKQFIASVQTEIELLQELDHPNIVDVIGSMEDKNYIYIVLEYVDSGSVGAVLTKYGRFPEKIASPATKQLLLGLSFLHSKSIIHRDIKAANLLINKDGVIKLADFGVSARLKSDAEKRYTVVGTPYWMAPEVISMTGHTNKSDIWSVGCTVVEMLTGHPPYWEHDQMRAIFCVVQDESPPIPGNLSPECDDFLRKCFNKNANQRASAEELLSHPWISGMGKGKPIAKQWTFAKLKKTVKKYNKKHPLPPTEKEAIVNDLFDSSKKKKDKAKPARKEEPVPLDTETPPKQHREQKPPGPIVPPPPTFTPHPPHVPPPPTFTPHPPNVAPPPRFDPPPPNMVHHLPETRSPAHVSQSKIERVPLLSGILSNEDHSSINSTVDEGGCCNSCTIL